MSQNIHYRDVSLAMDLKPGNHLRYGIVYIEQPAIFQQGDGNSS